MSLLDTHLNPLVLDRLRDQFKSADPVPFIVIDDFLREEFARKIVAEYPCLDDARQAGHEFSAINERGKIQITDPARFGENTRQLHRVLSSREWLEALEYVSGIPQLLADEHLVGGGIHVMGPNGHLDVHIDFNLIPDRGLHRRLNILVFFNENWSEEWGGRFELWDKDVKQRRQAFSPVMNRCVVFETSEVSFHGVERVRCPKGRARQSFAGYYYTTAPPVGWQGRRHSTVFKARPEERIKGTVLMPAERVLRVLSAPWRKLTRGLQARRKPR